MEFKATTASQEHASEALSFARCVSAASKSYANSSLVREFVASGMSVCCANVVLNPVEVIKTRMMLANGAKTTPSASSSSPAAAASESFQLSTRGISSSSSSSTSSSSRARSSTTGSSQYSTSLLQQPATSTSGRPTGFFATGSQIVTKEGPRALTRGIHASAARAIFNGGIRLGLYGPIKGLLSRDGDGSNLGMGQKVLAGSISGGIGALATSPMELVKTQLQAPQSPYRSAGQVLRWALQQHGLPGLWLGATPGVLRVTLLNASMCASYDEVKRQVSCYTGWAGKALSTQLTSAMIAGLVTTTVINPADVVRAYIQTGRGTGVLAVAGDIWKTEGLAAFMKGWTAAYARTGPQTLIIFMVSETLRPVFGLKDL